MPDIIFLDWHMPGSNTIGFVTAIRQIKTGKQPYILFCITEHDEATLTRATAAGIDSTIFKPFDRGTLAAKFAEIEALAA